MKDNREYFKELVGRLQNKDYRKIVLVNGERKGYQVKFGHGVSLTVNTTEGRAFIALFDNGEIDIDAIVNIIEQERKRRAGGKPDKAVIFSDLATLTPQKKTFWQRLFNR